MNEYSLQRIAARCEIQDRIHQWARACDRRDWVLAASIFTADATDDHGSYKGPIAGFIVQSELRHQAISHSSHHIGNILIEFSSSDQALVESYCFAWTRYQQTKSTSNPADRPTAKTFDLFMTARYIDVFVHTDEKWKIKKRTAVMDNITRFEAPSLTLDPGWILGIRGPEDLVFSHPRS